VTSRRIHRVAHRTTDPAKHREVGRIGEIFFSEDVRDDDIEREDDVRLNIEGSQFLARACADATRRDDGNRGRGRASARRCAFRAKFS
jgi:hypothetical protein